MSALRFADQNLAGHRRKACLRLLGRTGEVQAPRMSSEGCREAGSRWRCGWCCGWRCRRRRRIGGAERRKRPAGRQGSGLPGLVSCLARRTRWGYGRCSRTTRTCRRRWRRGWRGARWWSRRWRGNSRWWGRWKYNWRHHGRCDATGYTISEHHLAIGCGSTGRCHGCAIKLVSAHYGSGGSTHSSDRYIGHARARSNG
jgi:hypothetical protein